jgi:hypothetical protein
VIHDYLGAFQKRAEPGCPDIELYRKDQHHGSPARIRRLWVNDDTGSIPTLDMGQAFVLTLEVETDVEVRGGSVSFELKTTEGARVTVIVSLDAGFQVFAAKGRHLISCAIDGLILPPGQYLADARILGSAAGWPRDVVLNYPLFAVEDRSDRVLDWPDRPWGAVHCQDLEWNLATLEDPRTALKHAELLSERRP